MAQLTVRLLGGHEVFTALGSPVDIPARKARALLAYIALRPGVPLRREQLATLLWGEFTDARARANLRQTLKILRKSLGPTACGCIVSVGESVHLDPAGIDVDVWTFEMLCRQRTPPSLESATALYRGELLEDFAMAEEPFEEWLLLERARLHRIAVDTYLELLQHRMAESDHEGATRTAERLLSLDPLREAAHRALMRLHARRGDRVLALEQYALCRRLLREELGVEPDPATEHLHGEVIQSRQVSVEAPPERAGDVPAPSSYQPTLAVLPFINLSGDPEQEYFADGIAEDLITELSRLRWLLVTARNSTFTYKGQAVDVKQVGRDLGVRYVVEGSVRRAGERVRISAQLVDATTGKNIWAERYDRELTDIFALQDEITETLVAALQGEVGEFERERAHRKPPGSLDAWESYQRGMWHLWRFNAEDLSEARRLFERAADLDPDFALAVAALGYSLFLQVVNSYTDSPLETLEQASRLANKAVALDDKEAMAHFSVGRVQTMRGEYDAAIPELRTAIDLNPSLALAHFGLAFAFVGTGQLDEATSELDTAIRLSPRDPVVHEFYSVRALARLLSGDYEAAVENARRAIRHPAAGFWPHAHLASALAHLDRREEAKIARDKLLEVEPNFGPDVLLVAFSPLNPEALRPQFKTWIDGLRKAGLDIPDEPAAVD